MITAPVFVCGANGESRNGRRCIPLGSLRELVNAFNAGDIDALPTIRSCTTPEL